MLSPDIVETAFDAAVRETIDEIARDTSIRDSDGDFRAVGRKCRKKVEMMLDVTFDDESAYWLEAGFYDSRP